MGMKNNLKKGATELLVLKVLSQGDMYGYQIKQEIDVRSNNLFSILEGSLYPILYRLTQNGYLSEHSEIVKNRSRIYYHMEEDGFYYLARCLQDYQEITQGVYQALNKEFFSPSIEIPVTATRIPAKE